MKRDFKVKVSNWGNYPMVEKEVIAEDNLIKIKEYVRTRQQIIARGNGRCYGDASLAEHIFSTSRLNKFISFDRLNGVIECESGVLLSDILAVVVPQGYFLAVTPGTKYITVGGAIASDVHGKNHHAEGSFSDYVLSFELINSEVEVLTCSREENADLFWATVGGMGLTGIILSAKLQLKNIETSYIRQETIKAKNLDEIFQLFDESENWTYNVAWIDCMQKGENIGRSLMMRGEHALRAELLPKLQKNPLALKKDHIATLPFYLPEFLLNSFSIRLVNWFYYRKQSSDFKANIVHYEPFFYPLDVLGEWNKMYGKKGFIQYQMVLPKNSGKQGMREILETIAHSGNGSFLAVLKLFGKQNQHPYNSFPMEGYTLALDFKVNKKLPALVQALDAIVEKYGGRIYRTKDSMSKSSLTSYLKNVENTRFSSLQSERIQRGL